MSTAEATAFADSIKTLGDSLVNLKVLEVLQLTKYLKEAHGLEAAAVAVAARRRRRPAAEPPLRPRPNSTSSLRPSAPTRFRSSRLSERPRPWASKRPKIWSSPLPRRSRPASPRTTPRTQERTRGHRCDRQDQVTPFATPSPCGSARRDRGSTATHALPDPGANNVSVSGEESQSRTASRRRPAAP